MRLLTRRIHRAFPQLDPYPDEVCWKFIDAARGSRGVRTLSKLSIALVGLILTPVGCLLWAWLFAAMIGTDAISLRASGGKLALLVLATPFTLGLGPAGAYFWRDRLLGWRLRYVLGTSGHCPACRYSLIGLALTDHSTVFCPECGAECEVDPSLGELARGTTGRVRTKPAGDHPADLAFKRPPLLSPAKGRLLKRALLAAAVFVFVLLPGAAGVWELLIRRDAAAALADRARLEAQFQNLLAGSGLAPPGSAAAAGRVSTAAAFARADDALAEAEHRWMFPPSAPDQAPPIYGLEPLAAENLDAWAANTGLSPEQVQHHRQHARELMRLCRELNLPDLLSAVAASTPELPEALPRNPLLSVGTLRFPPGAVGTTVPMESYLEALALECRRAPVLNPTEALRLLDTFLGLARVQAPSPLYADKAWALRNELRAHALLLDLLATHPDPAALDAAAAILDRQAYDLRLADLAECCRLQTLASLANVFADYSQVRLGPFSRFAEAARWAPASRRRLGWYAENRDLANARCTVPSALFATDEITRGFAVPPPAPLPLPAAMYIQDPTTLLIAQDVLNARRRGLRLMLALERHRAAGGAYPARLADLVPAQLPALPADPWTGQPFVYAPRPTPDGQPAPVWPFVLYALGPDRSDNGGVPAGRGQRAGFFGLRAAPGADEVINPERARPPADPTP